MKKLIALAATLAGLSGAWAQGVGAFQNVQGLVTIGQGNTLANAVAGAPVPNGARIVTTANGSAVIRLAGGCVIPLGPNQAITIDVAVDCRTLLSRVTPVGGAAVAGFGAPGLGPFLGGVALLEVVVAERWRKTLSGS